jgi:exodeoxyribonuclease VII large subunit
MKLKRRKLTLRLYDRLKPSSPGISLFSCDNLCALPEHFIRLSALAAEIHRTISDQFAGRHYWVMGDVTNHTYKDDRQTHFFELVEKDPASGNLLAKIQAKAWGSGSRAIDEFTSLTGQRFTSNISVLISVEVQYHAQYGLQLNLLQIDVNFTLGALEQQKRQTLLQLVERNPGVIWKVGEKYFTKNNQLALPAVLQRIAVIASRDSAGAEDLRQTLLNNGHGYTFMVDEYHAPVQGDRFADEIVNQLIAIYNSGKTYDAVVLTRGGGAQTDFLIFDNYRLCLAIARFPVPVITGIGHFRNESIADLMSHTAAKTPTKAAETIIAHNRAFEENIARLQHTIAIRSQQQFSKRADELAQAYSKIITQTNRTIAARKNEMNRINQVVTAQSISTIFNNRKKLVDATTSLVTRPRIIVAQQMNEVANISRNMAISNARFLKSQREYLNGFASTMRLVSPMNILKRCFAIIKTSDNRIYTGNRTLKKAEKLTIVLSQQKLEATLQQQIQKDATDTDL